MTLNYLTFFILFNYFLVSVFSSDTQCPVVPSLFQDKRQDKSKLRLVQYNIEWMFIDYYSNSNCPGSGCTWSNQTQALTHLDYISTIINDLKPDIINFCEIEGCDELNMIVNKTNKDYNPYLIKGTDTATGQNVGMLTLIDPIVDLYRTETKYSYPIPNSNCGYNGNGNYGVSKHYITKFNWNSLNIAMISAHLLAFPTELDRCSEREAQAQVLQEQIMELITNKYEVIMLGDLNDFDNLIPDVNSNKPISQVLDILKGNKGLYSGKYELKSVGEKIPQSQRYSEYWDSNGNCNITSNDFSMIDHILITPYLYEKISNAFSYHAYPHGCNASIYNSDHDPVVVDFNL
jgi:exonuclease III